MDGTAVLMIAGGIIVWLIGVLLVVATLVLAIAVDRRRR